MYIGCYNASQINIQQLKYVRMIVHIRIVSAWRYKTKLAISIQKLDYRGHSPLYSFSDINHAEMLPAL